MPGRNRDVILIGEYEYAHLVEPISIPFQHLSQVISFYNASMLKKGWKLEWTDLEPQMMSFAIDLWRLNKDERTRK